MNADVLETGAKVLSALIGCFLVMLLQYGLVSQKTVRLRIDFLLLPVNSNCEIRKQVIKLKALHITRK